MDDHQIDSDDHQIDSSDHQVAGAAHESDGGPGRDRHEQPPVLLEQWAASCRRRGIPDDHCRGPEALYLVTAVETALRRGSHTPHLGRAARSWGIRTGSPGDAVAILSCLREVLVGSGPGASPPPPQLHLVLDQLMLQAVDAAAGTLHVAARTDPLTGCANRRALADDLRRAVSSARQSGLDLAVVAIDLDGLKKINDTHGHAAGDTALSSLVTTTRGSLRESDSLYRVGGDEFVVLAPFTDAAGARELMRRVEHAGGPRFSWGVSSLSSFGFGDQDDPQQLLQAADADLYEQRRARRHRAVFDSRRRRTLAVVSVAATVAATVAGASSMIAGSSRSTATANGLLSPTPSGGGQVPPARAGSLPSSSRLPGTGSSAVATGAGSTAVAGGATVAATAAVRPSGTATSSGQAGALFHFAAPRAGGLDAPTVTGAPGSVVALFPGGQPGSSTTPGATPGPSRANSAHRPPTAQGPQHASGLTPPHGPGGAGRSSGQPGAGPHGPGKNAGPGASNRPTVVTTAATSQGARDARSPRAPMIEPELAPTPPRPTPAVAPPDGGGPAPQRALIAERGTEHAP